jgi:hypothetical protein
MEQPKTGQDSVTGLIGGAFGLAKNLLGLVISRLELAALEFSEIGGNLLKIAVLFALALMAGWPGTAGDGKYCWSWRWHLPCWRWPWRYMQEPYCARAKSPCRKPWPNCARTAMPYFNVQAG